MPASPPTADPGRRSQRVLSGHHRPTRQSLTDVCVQALTDAIERGVYPAGGPLPSETDLADQLDVSRATLREALRTLEDRQLIIRRHRSEEHTSELQSRRDLVCRLLLE